MIYLALLILYVAVCSIFTLFLFFNSDWSSGSFKDSIIESILLVTAGLIIIWAIAYIVNHYQQIPIVW